MSTVLFLLSAIMFQLPFGIYQHTIRRFKRMQTYNPVKAFDYEFENGSFRDNTGLSVIVFISGLGLALIPLFLGLNFHWLILIIANLLCLYFITPFVAFFIYPKEAIYTTRILKFKAIVFVVLGIVLLVIAK